MLDMLNISEMIVGEGKMLRNTSYLALILSIDTICKSLRNADHEKTRAALGRRANHLRSMSFSGPRVV